MRESEGLRVCCCLMSWLLRWFRVHDSLWVAVRQGIQILKRDAISPCSTERRLHSQSALYAQYALACVPDTGARI